MMNTLLTMMNQTLTSIFKIFDDTFVNNDSILEYSIEFSLFKRFFNLIWLCTGSGRVSILRKVRILSQIISFELRTELFFNFNLFVHDIRMSDKKLRDN